MELRVVDLFAGAGGISEGFRLAGYTVIAGTDHDPDAAATYRLNFPDATTVCGDIRSSSVRKRVVELASEADVLVGGPPCQAFSQVRNHARLMNDPRNSLYREFIAVLAETLPAGFLVENVPGLDQMGVREQIALDLSLDGEYDVLSQIVNAADFGVPQTRNRLVFVGVRRTVGSAPEIVGTGVTRVASLTRTMRQRRATYIVAPAVDADEDRLERLADPDDLSAVTAEQAIGDLVDLPLGHRLDEIAYSALSPPASAYQRLMRSGDETLTNVQVPRMNGDTGRRLRAIPPGGNHRDLDDSLKERYLSDQRWGPDAGTGRLARRHYYAYRRLHPAIWSWTLNTKGDAVYHYGPARALSVREFARLHSFPDSFRFTTDLRKGEVPGRISGGPSHSRYRQVGNAVPPLLASAIAEHLAKVILSSAVSHDS